MPKSHVKFHSAHGKRMVLVVDDEMVNREILRNMLDREYEVMLASNGEEAFRLILQNRSFLSLVLLDLIMPGMHGIDLLRKIRNDSTLAMIPIIVMTADKEAEVDCLDLGANDFISKPFPEQEVLLARARHTIELSEDRQIIQSTERDDLTGLFNKDYFYSYANQLDQFHVETRMDAMLIDINHFHMINERYGKKYGDKVLRSIGERLLAMISDSEGIVGRKEADSFLVYCPHRTDYHEILEKASAGLADAERSGNRVRLRMGVYADVDKSTDIERRFDRAKLAADTVRGSFTKTVAIYDSMMHESEVYAEQLLEDFDEAVEKRQFIVFYQPKFDISSDNPVLSSAEALIRWDHPELGMISPGIFIPLFEENGLIQKLDRFVWQEAARQIRVWYERTGIKIPVSVNVSRIDLYDPGMNDFLLKILKDNDISTAELLLEITESAYTQDSEQIIETINKLRDLGFKIEMDDFGTGYSSLNMISTLPIDALKLDMQFIRNAFKEGRDTRLIEVIIDIADYLGVPVIAEGVETQEQLDALKAMGCDIVQGYYFSKPIPPAEYERFIEQRSQTAGTVSGFERKKPQSSGFLSHNITYASLAQALSTDYKTIYYINPETDQFFEYTTPERNGRLTFERSGDGFFDLIGKEMAQAVCMEDQPLFFSEFNRDNIIKVLDTGRSFSVKCRAAGPDISEYIDLKIARMPNKHDRHIVIGVSRMKA